MKRLITAILLFACASAFANGRCMTREGYDASKDPSCSPEFVPVLAYHRVTDAMEPGMTVISTSRMASHLDILAARGFKTATVAQLVEHMAGRKELPSRSVVLTFDDGWRDQLEAAKLLKDRAMTGTFYVTSGHFGHGLYMSEDDVRQLHRDGFEIGAHSHTHFPAYETTRGMQLSEMVGELIMSRLMLKNIIGQDVKNYAWPYGYATRDSVIYAERLGFDSTAMINARSQNRVGGRAMEMERLNIDGRCTAEQIIVMVSTGNLVDCK